MLDLQQITQVADKAASSVLKKVGVSRVFTEQTADSDGNEALSVTVVIRRGRKDELTGDYALDTIVKIGTDLRNAGEERLAIVHFAAEEELDPGADTEC